MSTGQLIAVLILAGLIIAFHTYCTKVYGKIKEQDEASNSISLPPEIPKVTPPVFIDRVKIGESTYFDHNCPEIIVTVFSVENGIVSFMTQYVEHGSLPTDQFLVKYTLRTQTKISQL